MKRVFRKRTFVLVCPLLLLLATEYLFCNKKSEVEQVTSCHSYENYQIVYSYLKNKTKNSHTPCYNYKGYDLCIVNQERIAIKKENYTFAHITSKDIYSLNKSAKHNQRWKDRAMTIFCELLKQSAE